MYLQIFMVTQKVLDPYHKNYGRSLGGSESCSRTWTQIELWLLHIVMAKEKQNETTCILDSFPRSLTFTVLFMLPLGWISCEKLKVYSTKKVHQPKQKEALFSSVPTPRCR